MKDKVAVRIECCDGGEKHAAEIEYEEEGDYDRRDCLAMAIYEAIDSCFRYHSDQLDIIIKTIDCFAQWTTSDVTHNKILDEAIDFLHKAAIKIENAPKESVAEIAKQTLKDKQ